MELKQTQHSYYCSASNYYVNGHNNYGRSEYDTWEEFKEDWLLSNGELDDDYNHVFRFDIQERLENDDESTGEFQLWLFFILQRKGIYRPVLIKKITKEDMVEITKFLEDRWEYLKHQWSEFSK